MDDKAREHDKKGEKLRGKAKENFESMTDGFNSGGYEWCCENLGTKWGICRAEIEDETDYEGESELRYSFETAWSPPSPVIIRMSVLFPSLKFELRYFEGANCFNGILVCEKGKVTTDKQGEYFGSRGG